MKNNITYIAIVAIALVLVASPLAGFAKENEKNKGNNNNSAKKEQVKNDNTRSDKDKEDDNDNDDKDNKNGNRDNIKNVSGNSCLKAYGHLFAFGWSKKNNNDDDRKYVSENCYLPFGINKKFRGNNASTTPDVTAPLITNVTFNTAKKQAEVRFTTDEYSDSTVFWSTTNSVDTSASSTQKAVNGRFTKNHKVVLKNLTPDTTYYVIVRSRDFAGNSSLSGVNSFKTKAPSPDTQVPVISNVVTVVGTTTINVGWKTNENATDRVYYSTILPVTINASSTLDVSNASSTKNHALTISGLNPNTTYYLVIESTDTAGNMTTSATFSAKTNTVSAPADVTPPVLSSITATPGASTTTVAWTTDELATSKVYYSSTNPLDISATTTSFITNSALSLNHSISVLGLATSTTYYFKVQSVDASGNTRTSDQFSATTTSGI